MFYVSPLKIYFNSHQSINTNKFREKDKTIIIKNKLQDTNVRVLISIQVMCKISFNFKWNIYRKMKTIKITEIMRNFRLKLLNSLKVKFIARNFRRKSTWREFIDHVCLEKMNFEEFFRSKFYFKE